MHERAGAESSRSGTLGTLLLRRTLFGVRARLGLPLRDGRLSRDRHAEQPVCGFAVLDQVLRHALGIVHGDGEAHPDVPGLPGGAPSGGDGHVDADQSALGVEQCAAGVAWVDRRVGLDHVDVDGALGALLRHARDAELELSGPARTGLSAVLGDCGGGHGDGAVQGGDDPVRDGPGQAQWCTDGDGPVSDVQLSGGAHLDGGQPLRVDLHHREVRVRVQSDDLGGVDLTVGRLHGDVRVRGLPAHGDHMSVGEDVTLIVQDHAGAGPGTLAVRHGERDHRGGGLRGSRGHCRGVLAAVDVQTGAGLDLLLCLLRCGRPIIHGGIDTGGHTAAGQSCQEHAGHQRAHAHGPPSRALLACGPSASGSRISSCQRMILGVHRSVGAVRCPVGTVTRAGSGPHVWITLGGRSGRSRGKGHGLWSWTGGRGVRTRRDAAPVRLVAVVLIVPL